MKSPTKESKPIEIRRDAPVGKQVEGEIDEVCGRGTWHFEMMNDSQMSVMLYGELGDTLCLFIEPKRWSKHGSPHVRARVFWYESKQQRKKTSGDAS